MNRPAIGRSAAKIPCTIITGFLGAGKTTLVRHLLENPGQRRLAVLVNEFGDTGFDSAFIEGCGIKGCTADDIVELPNGCLCCTVADDFVPALEKLMGRSSPPDHILIETSGLALPKPLITAFNWPAIRTRVTVDGVIALVDGPAVAAGEFAAAGQAAMLVEAEHDNPVAEVFEDQILAADIILINKTDLMTAADREKVKNLIVQQTSSEIKQIEISYGQINPDVLLGLAAMAEEDLTNRRSLHDDAGEHDHDDFESLSLPLAEVKDPAILARQVAEVAALTGVLRVKGFASVDGRPVRLVVQGVGRRVNHHFDRPWLPGETRQGVLVVIGLTGLDRTAMARILAG